MKKFILLLSFVLVAGGITFGQTQDLKKNFEIKKGLPTLYFTGTTPSINFNHGEVIITNTNADLLTISGGTLALTGTVPLKIGVKSNYAGNGHVLVGSTDNTGGVQIFCDDDSAIVGDITSPLWTRYMVTRAQSSGATQTGLFAQLKTKDLITTFTNGSITAAKVYNQAGVVTLAGTAEFGIINAGTTLLGEMTVASGTQFSGIDINLGGVGPVTVTGTGIGAGLRIRNKGEGATWPVDISLQNGETISNATNGSIGIVGAINQAIAGGTVVTSAGLLGGGGTSTSATQTLGALGGKAFSYYLSSTSATASHVLTGYYMNVNYGATGGATAAPSGDVIRGRAYLMGDAAGTSALTGGAFSVELEAATASNTGLTAGLRGNLVLPAGVLTNSGTYYGTMAEVFLGGASTDTRAYTTISPLGIVIGGTAATNVVQLSNMVAMDITVPANMVTADGTLVVTGATGAVAAGLKIRINGTDYWIMLATADE